MGIIEVKIFEIYLISGSKKIISHFFQVRCLASVDEPKHFLEYLMVNICDCDAVLFSFLHFVFEHGGKDGTSSYLKTVNISHRKNSKLSNDSPARIALCAWNSLPPTESVTSLNFSLSKRLPKSSESLHSGTLNWIMLLCPDILTLSATTLTYSNEKELH